MTLCRPSLDQVCSDAYQPFTAALKSIPSMVLAILDFSDANMSFVWKRSSKTSSTMWTRKGPLSFPAIPSNHLKGPSRSSTVSPMSSPAVSNKKYLPPLPSMALPPCPPNQGCASVTCTEPLTSRKILCLCLAYSSSTPIQILPYTFFPMVSELAEEIAQTVPLDQSQVRIMGADAADLELEKTSVLIHESHKQKMNAVVSSLSSCEQ